MNNTNEAIYDDLPPLPKVGETGSEVCAVIQLYLAVMDELTPQQVEQISEHIVTCAACSEAFELMEHTTRIVGSLPGSAPSARVDAAMLAMMQRPPDMATLDRQRFRQARPVRRQRVRWLVGELVAAAVIVLALAISLHSFGLFGSGGPQTAFALPATLSWNQFVVYHSQTLVGTNGELYQVNSYDDLGTGAMHVETTMAGQIDVVAVGNAHQMVGMDTLHHVAQMDADQWSVNDSVFDLAALRHDLQTNHATFLDIDTFKGQRVYRVRCSDGLVMLLDMHYMPVNVLRGAVGPGTGYPIYATLKVMPSSQVPESMWDMSIPPDYHMGTLPQRP